MQQELTYPIRVVYSKTGRSRYISHLDTMRTITRALRRSGLAFWYTQGFNPHLYLTFPLPLALGVESLCEIVDLRLTKQMELDDVKSEISAQFPPGFEIKSIATPSLPTTAIAWAEYKLTLTPAQNELGEMAEKMRELFGQQTILVSKKSKKGEQLIDILPHAQLLGVEIIEGRLVVVLRLAAGTSLNISPRLVLKAFCTNAVPPESVSILRTRVLDSHLENFR